MPFGKRLKNIADKIDRNQDYLLVDAVKLVKENATAKFDETIEVAMNLGVDPRHADQMVRGMVQLPHGTGKTVRVAVFARGDKAEEARASGADIVGAEELAEKIEGGEIGFDRCISTPDLMPVVGKLGRVLGPKGLMPNPKLGTVTDDISLAVKNAKAGQIELKNDKDGNIGLSFGKKSFSDEKLLKNFNTILDILEREKSNLTIKGDLIKNIFITSTMGVSYKVKLSKNI